MVSRPLRLSLVTLAALAAAVLPARSILTDAVAGQADNKAVQRAGVVAIRNATIVTVSRGTINNGTIVLRDGKIAAVGANVQIPAGADVVDGTGKFVSPGIIDAHSHIANDAINEGATAVSSMTGMGEVLNPTDIAIQRDLAGGLTVANILHGSANPIGGKTVVIKLRWGVTKGEDLLFEGALPGIKFALGENPKRPGAPAHGGRAGTRRRGRASSSSFATPSRARRPTRRRGRTTRRPRRPTGRAAAAPRPAARRARRGPRGQAARALPLVSRRRNPDDDPPGRRDGLQGRDVPARARGLQGREGNCRRTAPAHSTFSDWWGYKIEAEDAIPGNAALMTHKGVNVSINSDSAEHARRLNTEAAKSVRWGDSATTRRSRW